MPCTVLVADDDPDLRDIVRCILEPAGFEVHEAADGASALQAITADPPGLIILDYVMPGLTGPQVCQHLAQDVLLRHIPVILLTGRSEIHDKIHGMDAGADDYVVKPFEPQELLARVKMVLRRTTQRLDANPLTKLPGNQSIQRELEQRLQEGAPLAVCYLDLDAFKAFNDHYGFKRGDEVIRHTASILLHATRTLGTPQDFVGHIGGDDFLLMTSAQRAEAICEAIIQEFDASTSSLYDEQDRRRGYIVHTDRRGQLSRIPLMSISIALVTSDEQPLTHPGQIAKIGAELKAYAKRFSRSLYVKNRRKIA